MTVDFDINQMQLMIQGTISTRHQRWQQCEQFFHLFSTQNSSVALLLLHLQISTKAISLLIKTGTSPLWWTLNGHMLQTPTWLMNKAVDVIAEEPEEYDMMRREFMDILVTEEQRLSSSSASNHRSLQLSAIMEESWRVGTFWYTLALTSPTSLFTVFYKQIQPRFLKNYPEHDTF
ncbi:hypothetical protein GB937_010517 [Aspergillus fischeri]|nr:hypothetical protein GB937_010517 [Aspergillus fischeri]